MVMESFDLSEPAQKRDTRKLLIAGLTCIFLAVVSIAIVIAVILRQNGKTHLFLFFFSFYKKKHIYFWYFIMAEVVKQIITNAEMYLMQLCFNVCLWLVVGHWFHLDVPVSSSNKTDIFF